MTIAIQIVEKAKNFGQLSCAEFDGASLSFMRRHYPNGKSASSTRSAAKHEIFVVFRASYSAPPTRSVRFRARVNCALLSEFGTKLTQSDR